MVTVSNPDLEKKTRATFRLTLLTHVLFWVKRMQGVLPRAPGFFLQG